MSNVQRVPLSEDVEDVIDRVDQNTAFYVLEEAAEIGQHESRAMSLAEALDVIRRISQQIEALG